MVSEPRLSIVGACLVVTALAAPALASGVTVYLDDLGAHASSRWQDVADQGYSETYTRTFTYGGGGGATTVGVTFDTVGVLFSGTLTATNLKPNFAYQIKLDGGGPEQHPTANENLGLAGRWWEQTWNGSTWSSGSNLNDQPDDPDTHANNYPNTLSSNDLTYFDHKSQLYGSTGHPLYRHTGYLLLGYFVTNAAGNATVPFTLDNSYHVLFRATSGYLGQRDRTDSDGPIVQAVLTAESYSEDAYGSLGATTTIDVFGQWERLPKDAILLPQGTYDVNLRLTEECFHSGSWTTVMAKDIAFTIVPEVSSLSLLLLGCGAALLRRSRRQTPAQPAGEDPSPVGQGGRNRTRA